MITNESRAHLVTVLGAAFMAASVFGCAESGDGADVDDPNEAPSQSARDDELEATSQSIIGGSVTSIPASVGTINAYGYTCTGTLIGPKLVLTAAHCFDFDKTKSGLDGATTTFPTASNGTFTVVTGAGVSVGRTIRRIATVGNVLGSSDLAVAELNTAYSPDQVLPFILGTAPPAASSTVTAIGHGCRSRTWSTSQKKFVTDGTDFQKSYRNVAWGSLGQWQTDQNNVVSCPGDSGGPILDSNNRIVGVISGYTTEWNSSTGAWNRGFDIIASPVSFRAALENLRAIYNPQNTYGTQIVCPTCSKVALRTDNGSNFIVAPNTGTVKADARSIGSTTTFRFVNLAGGEYALQTSSGYFLSASSDTVTAGATAITASAVFTMVANGGGAKMTFKVNGRYLQATNAGGSTLKAAPVTTPGSWERFNFEAQP